MKRKDSQRASCHVHSHTHYTYIHIFSIKIKGFQRYDVNEFDCYLVYSLNCVDVVSSFLFPWTKSTLRIMTFFFVIFAYGRTYRMSSLIFPPRGNFAVNAVSYTSMYARQQWTLKHVE